jgi:DNA-binding response OmpR family regulator
MAASATAEIAILDPTPRTLRQVELVLTAAGYQVATFASPEAAREALVASSARLLVAELMLPGVDGLEFWAEIQRRRPPGGELGLLCFSAVSWGYVDLAALLGQRFGAGWLAKPALRSELVPAARRGRRGTRPTSGWASTTPRAWTCWPGSSRSAWPASRSAARARTSDLTCPTRSR